MQYEKLLGDNFMEDDFTRDISINIVEHLISKFGWDKTEQREEEWYPFDLQDEIQELLFKFLYDWYYFNKKTMKKRKKEIRHLNKGAQKVVDAFRKNQRLKSGTREKKVTEEMVEYWLGSYKVTEEAIQSLTEIANGDYSPTALFNDISQTWEKDS